jgi:energy-coupling factor transport system ATP-binding protein
VIRFEKVSFRYPSGTGRVDAGIAEVDFEVGPGECVLVCGASGSGKTTVARLANGLAPSLVPGELSGRVLVDGQDLADLHSWERAARIGSVFQNPRTQFFNTDVAGEVAFGMESLAWPEARLRSRTAQALADLGLEDLAERSIFSLSGGQKQRVAFASAYASEPGNYVLDEPTSNLDAASITALRGYIDLARSQGNSILVAEHRLYWLAGCVDRVILMDEGRIARTWTGPEFWALSTAERAGLGLRCAGLAELSWTPDPGRADLSGGSLVARGLGASYGRRPVFSGVDFSIAAGEVVAVTGDNGAGKSTLSRLLCGLRRHSTGLLLRDGIALGRAARLQHGSLVFQDVNYGLFAASVRAEVTFGLADPDLALADGLLSRLGLEDLADRHPATLSGGQRQRLAVAASIAAGKRLLVFDEPTTGLDLAGMHRVARLVREIADDGVVVIVPTHDLEFVAAVCSRILRLSGGTLVEDQHLMSAPALQ